MYEHFKTDEKSEKKGVVHDYDDFRVTVARAGGRNDKYKKVVDRLCRPYRRAIDTETLSTEKSDEILMHAHAEAVVLNWEVKTPEGKWVKGIADPEDPAKMLDFNKANVLKVFKALPDLYNDIRVNSGKLTLYLVSTKEEAAKN